MGSWQRSSHLAVIAFLLGGLGCGSRTNPEPLVIGHVAPLTGADKDRGQHSLRGIDLALKEINSQEASEENKNFHRKFTVDHADTRSDRAAVRGVTTRLVTVGRVVSLLGGRELAQVDSLEGLAQSTTTPVVLTSAPLSRPTGSFLFFLGLPPAQQGQSLARFAHDELKDVPVALVHHADAGAIADAFAREYPADKIVGRWSYAAADKLAPVLEEMRKKQPAAVLFAGPAADLTALPTNALGDKAVVLLAGDDAGPGKWRPAGAVYAVTAFVFDEAIPAAKNFKSQYPDDFKELDAELALSYDAARMLFGAIKKAASIDGKKIRDTLASETLEGLTGPIRFDSERRAIRPAFVVEWKDGQAKLRKRYEPEEKVSVAGQGAAR